MYDNVKDAYKDIVHGAIMENEIVDCLNKVFKKQIRLGLVHIDNNSFKNIKEYQTYQGYGVDIVIFVGNKQIEIECKNLSPNTKQSISWCEDEIKKRFSPNADKKYVFISCPDSIQRTAKIDLRHNDISQIYMSDSKVLSRYNNLVRRNLYRNPSFLSLYRYIKKLLSDNVNKPRVYCVSSRLYVPYVYLDLFDYFKVQDIGVNNVLPNVKLKEIQFEIEI